METGVYRHQWFMTARLIPFRFYASILCQSKSILWQYLVILLFALDNSISILCKSNIGQQFEDFWYNSTYDKIRFDSLITATEHIKTSFTY